MAITIIILSALVVYLAFVVVLQLKLVRLQRQTIEILEFENGSLKIQLKDAESKGKPRNAARDTATGKIS